ncbi:MAG: FAD-binding oxidoreductase [Chloroflexota bacterium]
MVGTVENTSKFPDEDTIQALRTSLQGKVIDRNDPEYNDARAIWNGMIDRHPAVIARCSNTEDVVNAVNVAREHGLLVAVRGGGHNAAGKAVCDDGIVIDLSAMKDVTVDPESRTAWAQGGATWADFDAATTAHGLATTGGLISTTGVAGLTLGGGFGWLLREYGMACDNLIGAEVVTASGEVVNVSEDENADLLWGLRGGGGNFGIVTNFKFQLHPIGTVTSGMIVHPYERAREAIQRYREFSMSAPESLTTFCGLMTSPEGEKIVAYIIFHDGPEDTGRELLAPLLEWGPPVAADLAQVPYAQHQQMLDEGFPHGLHVYWRSDFLRELDDDLIDTLIDQFDKVTSPLSALVLEQFGGAVRRVPKDATAFVHREGEYNLAIISRWNPDEEPEPHIAWARGVHDAIRPYSTGVYVNYLGDEGADRVRAAYNEEVYQQLVDLKNRYDPTNLFRLNQNIEPTV